MKTISNFILEKLRIGKTTNIPEIRNLGEIQIADTSIKFIPNMITYDEKLKRMVQLSNVKKENKSYKRLCKSTMKLYSLFNTLICAICLQWDEAVFYIKKFIHDKYAASRLLTMRNIDEQLDALLYNMYMDEKLKGWTPNLTADDMRSLLERYFDLCNFNYKKY